MSLLKIPLILSSAIATQVSLSPPSSPSSNEVVRRTLNEQIIIWHVKHRLLFARVTVHLFSTILFDETIAQVVCWAISLAEIAVTVSRATGRGNSDMIQYAVGPLLRDIRSTYITPTFLFGTAFVVAGGLLRWWCYRTLGRFFTFQLSVRKGHQLITTGPYAIVRHPAYTANTLQFIGVLILYGSRTSWLRDSGVLAIPGLKAIVLIWLIERTITAICLVRRISEEEEVVKSNFGDDWKRWAKVVRYQLIPGIY